MQTTKQLRATEVFKEMQLCMGVENRLEDQIRETSPGREMEDLQYQLKKIRSVHQELLEELRSLR
jgi:hypothetical protein